MNKIAEPKSGDKVSPTETDQNLIRQVIHEIRRLMRAAELYTKELDKKYQVSAPQLSSLLALYEYGSLPPSQIAKLIMVNSSTVTGIIDRLEQKGLVQRTRTSLDRRVITIELTEAGQKMAEGAPPPIQEKIVNGLQSLKPGEIKQIINGLNMLTHMLDAQDLELEESTGRS